MRRLKIAHRKAALDRAAFLKSLGKKLEIYLRKISATVSETELISLLRAARSIFSIP